MNRIQMTTYELFDHAGQVPYEHWAERGIKIPVFDKDGTLSHANRLDFIPEVVDDLREILPGVFPYIAIASNNHDRQHVLEFAARLEDELDVEVFSVSRADGYRSKPHPEMARAIAGHFGVRAEQLGVIGDRRLTDVRFGRNVGAGALALCRKAGEGDTLFVPTIRRLEAGIVRTERLFGRAA